MSQRHYRVPESQCENDGDRVQAAAPDLAHTIAHVLYERLHPEGRYTLSAGVPAW